MRGRIKAARYLVIVGKYQMSHKISYRDFSNNKS